MTDIQPREPEHSEEYTKLLEELRHSFVSATNMAVKLYEQGKKNGLSNEVIRKDIEMTLEGIIKERRLREILPAELKRSYNVTVNSTLIAESLVDRYTGKPLPIPHEIYEDSLRRIAELWELLSGQDMPPSIMSDILVDLIKPSRSYWYNLLHRLNKEERITLRNWLIWACMLLDDRIKTSEEIEAASRP